MEVKSIEISRDKFKSEEEFNSILTQQINILLKLDYILVIKEQENIVVIEYEFNNPEYGCPYPKWTDPADE